MCVCTCICICICVCISMSIFLYLYLYMTKSTCLCISTSTSISLSTCLYFIDMFPEICSSSGSDVPGVVLSTHRPPGQGRLVALCGTPAAAGTRGSLEMRRRRTVTFQRGDPIDDDSYGLWMVYGWFMDGLWMVYGTSILFSHDYWKSHHPN